MVRSSRGEGWWRWYSGAEADDGLLGGHEAVGNLEDDLSLFCKFISSIANVQLQLIGLGVYWRD